jgi:hypothetical protein
LSVSFFFAPPSLFKKEFEDFVYIISHDVRESETPRLIEDLGTDVDIR